MKIATTKLYSRSAIGLFIGGILISVLMFKTLVFHSDNIQIMDKAVRLIQTGQWTHFGNLATKVGSIPGSFLTAITAGPMLIYYSPYAAMAVILLFHILSFYFLKKTTEDIFQSHAVKENAELSFLYLLLAIFYWLNPWRVEQSELYNPGYLFLFSALHLWTSQKMQQKSFWLTFVHVLTIGFCFQVHFSFLILAFVSLILFVTGQLKVNWKGFFLGSTLVGLSLLPYVLERFFAPELIEKQMDFTKSDAFFGRNAVLFYPVIKAILYFFRMGSLYFGRHIFSEIQFEWIGSEPLRLVISFIFHALKWLLAALTLFFSFKWLGSFLKNYTWKLNLRIQRKLDVRAENRFDDYMIALFISTVLAAGLSPVEFNHWHLILCFPAISLFMVFKIYKTIQANANMQKYKTTILIVFTFTFVFWDLFMALGSRSHSYKNDYQKSFQEHYSTNK